MVARCVCRDNPAVLFFAKSLATVSWWWWCRNLVSQWALGFGLGLGFDLVWQGMMHVDERLPENSICDDHTLKQKGIQTLQQCLESAAPTYFEARKVWLG